jgi:hypothetical protein
MFWAFSTVQQHAPSGLLGGVVSARFHAAAGWLHTVDKFSIRLKLKRLNANGRCRKIP